jgi:hypothetical protein
MSADLYNDRFEAELIEFEVPDLSTTPYASKRTVTLLSIKRLAGGSPPEIDLRSFRIVSPEKYIAYAIDEITYADGKVNVPCWLDPDLVDKADFERRVKEPFVCFVEIWSPGRRRRYQGKFRAKVPLPQKRVCWESRFADGTHAASWEDKKAIEIDITHDDSFGLTVWVEERPPSSQEWKRTARRYEFSYQLGPGNEEINTQVIKPDPFPTQVVRGGRYDSTTWRTVNGPGPLPKKAALIERVPYPSEIRVRAWPFGSIKSHDVDLLHFETGDAELAGEVHIPILLVGCELEVEFQPRAGIPYHGRTITKDEQFVADGVDEVSFTVTVRRKGGPETLPGRDACHFAEVELHLETDGANYVLIPEAPFEGIKKWMKQARVRSFLPLPAGHTTVPPVGFSAEARAWNDAVETPVGSPLQRQLEPLDATLRIVGPDEVIPVGQGEVTLDFAVYWLASGERATFLSLEWQLLPVRTSRTGTLRSTSGMTDSEGILRIGYTPPPARVDERRTLVEELRRREKDRTELLDGFERTKRERERVEREFFWINMFGSGKEPDKYTSPGLKDRWAESIFDESGNLPEPITGFPNFASSQGLQNKAIQMEKWERNRLRARELDKDLETSGPPRPGERPGYPTLIEAADKDIRRAKVQIYQIDGDWPQSEKLQFFWPRIGGREVHPSRIPINESVRIPLPGPPQ